MKHLIGILWILLLFQQLAFCAIIPPEPAPPVDDDDPICFRQAQYDELISAMERLEDYEGAEQLFLANAVIISVESRIFRKDQIRFLTVDFIYFLGTADENDYGRFSTIRVNKEENTTTGTITWNINQSQELVLKKQITGELENCFANSLNSLRACIAILSDQTVNSITMDLLPYYKLQSVRTPFYGPVYPQTPIPVTIQFINQTNSEDLYTIFVDFTEGEEGFSIREKGKESDEKGEEL